MVPHRISVQSLCGMFAICILIPGAWWYSTRSSDNHMPAVFTHPALAENTYRETFLNNQSKYLVGGNLLLVDFPAHVEDGHQAKLTRRGLLYTHPHARATIVVCHGFMCSKFDVNFLRTTLFNQYNVFMFDFRAHGECVDEGDCCTFGKNEALDVMGAVAYLRTLSEIAHLPIIGYGFSMGAVAAIQAQSKRPDLFKALILDCPYDTSKNVLQRSIDRLQLTLFGYTFGLPGRSLLRKFAFNSYVQSAIKYLLKTIAQLNTLTVNTKIYPLNPVDSVKEITVPCFFIHCVHDEKISVDAAHQLFNNAAGYKRLWITNGRRHYDSIFYNPEKYIYKVNVFINDLLTNHMAYKSPQKIHYDKPLMQVPHE
jgi:pimeloyl-ACP methyl ester carboxylesterase